jgi:hypothetical protein
MEGGKEGRKEGRPFHNRDGFESRQLDPLFGGPAMKKKAGRQEGRKEGRKEWVEGRKEGR